MATNYLIILWSWRRERDSNYRFLDLVEQLLHRSGAWSSKGPGSHSRVLTTDKRQVYRAPGQAGPGNDIPSS